MQALAKLGLISISHGERARVCELTAQSIFHQVDAAAQIHAPDLAGLSSI